MIVSDSAVDNRLPEANSATAVFFMERLFYKNSAMPCACA